MPLRSNQIGVTPVDRVKKLQGKGMKHETKETHHVTSPTPPSAAERCSSRASTLSYGKDFCRICHCEGDSEIPLISPCYCSGSLRYVHQACLQQWIKSSGIKSCELCKYAFIMQTKTKPFSTWEKLDLGPSERRKLFCSVSFHLVALTCVVWSLYVLIERTTEEVQTGILEWPFWTKLIVVAIGVTGGVVFMYVQCKVYVQLCRRWRAYNRVIYVQNVPEKVPPADLENGRGLSTSSQSAAAAAAAAPEPRSGGGASESEGGGWPPADQQRRVSLEEAARGRVHVTIERSDSSTPMLPPLGAAADQRRAVSPADGGPCVIAVAAAATAMPPGEDEAALTMFVPSPLQDSANQPVPASTG